MLENTDIEAELIGQLLMDNARFDAVADTIDPADFSVAVHGRIYESALREYSKGKSVTPMTLKSYMDGDPDYEALGGIGYLGGLTGMVSMGPGAFDLARELRELSQRRRMQAGLTEAAALCVDMNTEQSEIVDAADAALTGDSKDTVHQPTGAECFDEMLAGFANKAQGVRCGRIRALDDLLGPIRPKQLVIGAGRPGMGKTALALSYAIGAAKAGHGVLFVSLEMSSEELAARMAADMCFDGDARVAFSAIRDGNFGPRQMDQIELARQEMKRLPFQVIDAGSLTTGRLASLVRRHARKMNAKGHKLELVVIDYLQLLRPDGRGKSAYEAVSEVSRSLKALAKDHSVGVFALAQLSREVEKRTDRRPQLSDLRDSGQIEQDADAVLFLMRQEYYMRQAEPEVTDPKRKQWEEAYAEVEGQIEFIIAKRRNGVTGSTYGLFHGKYQAVRG
jgi:replicative DNA helicase